MKTFYHVSVDYEEDIEEFVPRVPTERANGEDEVQKRICVSTTLNGCIKAAPELWYHMHTYVHAEYYDPYTHMIRLTTLLDHENKVGYLFKVYEFDLEEEEVVSAKVLAKNNWVPDAKLTNEHWVMKVTKPNRSYFVLLENPKEKNGLPVFDCTRYTLSELGKVENYYDTFAKQQEKENLIY